MADHINEIMARVAMPDKHFPSSLNRGTNDNGSPSADSADVYKDVMKTSALAKLLKRLHKRAQRQSHLLREAFENHTSKYTFRASTNSSRPGNSIRPPGVSTRAEGGGSLLTGST